MIQTTTQRITDNIQKVIEKLSVPNSLRTKEDNLTRIENFIKKTKGEGALISSIQSHMSPYGLHKSDVCKLLPILIEYETIYQKKVKDKLNREHFRWFHSMFNNLR